MTRHLGRQAVVVGAGVAGLTTARVLADFFERVLVLERDGPGTEGMPRPGVPQGAHLHALLAGGLTALTDLLPGFGRDLAATGAIPFEFGRDLRREIPGLGIWPQRDFGLHGISATRPAIEAVLRRRVSAWGNIVFRHGVRALAVVTDGDRAVGVHYDTGGWAEAVAADLVIDASGRGALTLDSLAVCQRPAPRETVIGVDICYATINLELPRSTHDFVGLLTDADAPASSREGGLLQVGENHLQALLVGRGVDQPPADLDAYRAFAGTLPTPTVATALDMARPISEIRRFRFRDCVWRHFGAKDAGSHIERLLPVGDAVCRFNPVFGQGMSVAAIEARMLRDMLTARVCDAAPLDGLAAQFLAHAEHLVGEVWQMTAPTDFLYPQTRGERPADLAARLQADEDRLRASFDDADLHFRMAEGLNLVAPVALAQVQAELA